MKINQNVKTLEKFVLKAIMDNEEEFIKIHESSESNAACARMIYAGLEDFLGGDFYKKKPATVEKIRTLVNFEKVCHVASMIIC